MGTLSVNRSLVKLRTGELIMAPPKSGRSRVIHLPLGAMACLRRLREVQGAHLTTLAQPNARDTLVFAHADGRPYTPDVVSRAFGLAARKAGMRGLRFHDLRHTHASLMLAAGVHLKVVSERLGHSGIGITGDLYSHVLPGLQKEAVMQWDETFERLVETGFTKDLQNHMVASE